MKKNYEALFTPLKIGNVEVKNRIMLAPMEGTSMISWMIPSGFRPEVHDFYIERAKDGVGLMIPGMVPVRSLFGGTKWLHENPKVFEPMKNLLDEIHTYGSKVFIQLGLFSGRNFVLSKAMGDELNKGPEERNAAVVQDLAVNMVAPDDGEPNVWMPEYLCRALTVDEIHEYVHAYAQSALLCKQAGVDGVEVHAVHEGYLMDQFTTKYTNHRTDEYGGNFENRYRFAVEVVREIKRLCGEDFPVSMRYSVTSKTIGFNQAAVPGEEFVEAGRDMEESERAIKLLEDAGVDVFSCDNGTYDAWFWAHPPVYMPLNCNLEEVKHIKKFTTKPVYCAGRMQADTAEEEIARHTIDGVAIGRQILTDECFLTKLQEGKEEEIRPCIGCHSGCLPIATYKGAGAESEEIEDHKYCALNPYAFEEKKYAPVRTEHPKKIAVVGAGIGGIEFAIQMAKRGHDVIVYEKSDRIGGVFNEAAAMDFKEKDVELLKWYVHQLEVLPVTVKYQTEINNIDEIKADEIVIATGAKPRRLKIKGKEQILDAVTFLKDRSAAGEKVVIIGGGLTGCEIAYQLVLDGKKPVIVEMMDDLVKAPGISAANTTMLRELMRYYKVPVYLESSTEAVEDGVVIVNTKDGKVRIPADTVIASIGYTSYMPFDIEEKSNVHVLGDALKVGNLKTAIWAANDLVLTLS